MNWKLWKRVAWVLLVANPVPTVSWAGDEGTPSPAPEKKAGGKKAGKKGAKAEAGSEEGKAAAGTQITVAQMNTWNKRMRQTYQAGKMENLAIVLGNVLSKEKELSETKLGRGVLATACRFKSGFVGQTGKFDETMEWIEKALGYGWLSADGFETFEMIPAGIKRERKFIDRMKKLREEVDTVMRKEFEEDVRNGIQRPSPDPMPLPSKPGSLPGDLSGLKPLDPAALAGRPACVIVTPIYHDGFTKEAPALERMAEIYKGQVELAFLFYQSDASDESRKEMTRKYVNEALRLKTKSPIPAAIVGRDFVKPLGIPFFPGHFFLDPKGSVVLRKDGYLEEGKLDFILAELAKIAKGEPPAPRKEAPPPPEPEEKKAEAPKPPAPPAPPPAPEKKS